MFTVICTLENASHLISGIEFTDRKEGGVISVAPVDKETAQIFIGIPGYEIVDAVEKAPRAKTPRAPKAAATVDAPEPDPEADEPDPEAVPEVDEQVVDASDPTATVTDPDAA